MSEQKDRDLLLGRKLKFGQEIGTNPPVPAKYMQRGCSLGCCYPFSWHASMLLPGSPWGLEWEWGINQEAELSTGDQKQVSARGLF